MSTAPADTSDESIDPSRADADDDSTGDPDQSDDDRLETFEIKVKRGLEKGMSVPAIVGLIADYKGYHSLEDLFAEVNRIKYQEMDDSGDSNRDR